MWPKNADLDTEAGERTAEDDVTPVERVYSNTLERKIWGNVCEHCGAYQGNHFMRQEAAEQSPPIVECDVCGEEHERYPDGGMSDAFGQGWIDCPDAGPIPTFDPRR